MSDGYRVNHGMNGEELYLHGEWWSIEQDDGAVVAFGPGSKDTAHLIIAALERQPVTVGECQHERPEYHGELMWCPTCGAIASSRVVKDTRVWRAIKSRASAEGELLAEAVRNLGIRCEGCKERWTFAFPLANEAQSEKWHITPHGGNRRCTLTPNERAFLARVQETK